MRINQALVVQKPLPHFTDNLLKPKHRPNALTLSRNIYIYYSTKRFNGQESNITSSCLWCIEILRQTLFFGKLVLNEKATILTKNLIELRHA